MKSVRVVAKERTVRELQIPEYLKKYESVVKNENEKRNENLSKVIAKQDELTTLLNSLVDSNRVFVDGILTKVASIYMRGDSSKLFSFVNTNEDWFKSIGDLKEIVARFGENTRLYNYKSDYLLSNGKRQHSFSKLSEHSLLIWLSKKVLIDNDLYDKVGNFVSKSAKDDRYFIKLYIRDEPLKMEAEM